MDGKRCFEGKYNSLYEMGQLIREPNFLYRVKGRSGKFGTFNAPGRDKLEYLIFREFSLSFGEVKSFLEEEEPEVEIYSKDDGTLFRHMFRYSKGRWRKLGKEELEGVRIAEN